MKRIVGFLIGVSLFICSTPSMAQMIIDNSQTAQQLVQDVLVGQGVQVSNITFIGTTEQIGYFDATNAVFPIEEGIAISTGNVNELPGPATFFASTIEGGAGDADLDVISSATTNDAAVLEFDFVPTGDSIIFTYVFGSEEYPEWVNSAFNDVFAFIISGPGYAGPFANGGENIALIPGTTMPVTIDNVNNVTPSNPQYYVDNTGGPANGIVFDGYTVAIAARAEVVCGETYTLRFAIADAGDSSFDSGVFLEARSFSSNAVEVDITTLSGDSAIVEGCTSASIEFRRPTADSLLLVEVHTSGNAIDGIDYSGLPDTLVFNPGDSVILVTVEALEDGNFEPVRDTLIITVYSLNLCGDTIESTGVIYIQEDYNLSIQTADVDISCPADSVMLVAEAGGGNPDYAYEWSGGYEGDT
ncbi:MAG: choice-of-anchor L domain-containing protein, partial [Flavobacteriales bacterium]|nr:choice-of-anchor L domain-containing protein [Flavobacteriales bacterium]